MVDKSNEENERVEVILAAAQRRFSHYGIAKTTMNEIAEDIGMSKASLYYYFPDKETLFSAVVEKEQNEFLLDIEKELEGKTDASELLRIYVLKRHTFFKRFINLSKLKLDPIKSLKSTIVKRIDAFAEKEIAVVEKILKIGFDAKEFEKIDAHHHAELLIVLMQGLRAFFLKKRSLDVPNEEDFQILEKHLIHLSEFFIKGITLK
jgi:TetR/AcrR family transcriptional regulator